MHYRSEMKMCACLECIVHLLIQILLLLSILIKYGAPFCLNYYYHISDYQKSYSGEILSHPTTRHHHPRKCRLTIPTTCYQVPIEIPCTTFKPSHRRPTQTYFIFLDL